MKYASSLEENEFIETGLFIDRITNGIPRGKIIEVWGDAGVGKSTLCEQIVAVAQKQQLKCLWADQEFGYDPVYASKMGIDNAKLGLIRERSAEDALDALEKEIEGGKWDVVVLDSIGALTPRAEIEKGAEGKVIGGQAGLLARFCRKVVPMLAMNGTALIVINHSFTDIMSGRLMTSGGRKLDYHKSLSIRLKGKGLSLKQGENTVGKVITAILTKDKVNGNEKMEADGSLIFHEGFSISRDQFEDELREGRIVKEGNTYLRDGEKLGVGKTKAAAALKALIS